MYSLPGTEVPQSIIADNATESGSTGPQVAPSPTAEQGNAVN